MQPAPKRHVGRLIFSILFLVIVLLAAWQRYFIYDQIRLWDYQPPAAVRQLADESTMLPSTRRTFYAYHPLIEDKDSFATHCTSNEKTIVLGCYLSNKGIYLYAVTDSRLHGEMEVTAAHEVLHAEYDRLNPFEKKKIDAMVSAAYSKVTDKRIQGNIQAYRDANANIPDELHSILATEVRDLPSDLETYYKRYFSNRLAIVTFSEQYEKEFSSRREQLAADDAKLKEMKVQVDAQTSQLKQQAASISSNYKKLVALRDSGRVEEYNSGVSSYNQSIVSYNVQVRALQALIAQYNDLVASRNAISLEETQLMKAIDSRPTTLQSQ